MKRILSIIIIVFLCLLCGCDNNSNKSTVKSENKEFKIKQLIDENPVKEIGYRGSEKRSFYTIKGKLDDDTKIIEAKENIQYINNSGVTLNDMVMHLYADSYGSLDTMPFNFSEGTFDDKYKGDITINFVKVNNIDVPFTQDNQVLKFNLKNELKSGECVNLDIDFKLKIPKTTGRLGYVDNDYSLTNWYPIVAMYNSKQKKWDTNCYHPIGESNYADYSDYKVDIEVPKNMIVVGTGIEREKSTGNQYNNKLVTLQENNVKDFALFMSPRYKCIKSEIDGISINSYFLSENRKVAERLLNEDKEAMEFYNKALGKYPYKEFDIVETNMKGGAMEYPTVIQMGLYEGTHLDNEIKEGSLQWIDDAVVHELVHQWWFGIVGNNEFEEAILDETFTTYWTTLYFEYTYGRNNVNSGRSMYSYLGHGEECLPVNRAVNKFVDDDQFTKALYEIGPSILEKFRNEIGEEKFIQLYRKYYEKYRFRNATLSGFLEVVEDVCGAERAKLLKEAFNSKKYDLNRFITK